MEVKVFLILNPLTEHAPFDIVAYKNTKFIRVQVKYCKPKNGVIYVGLRSCWSDKNGTHIKSFNSLEVDVISVYNPDCDEIYFVPSLEISNSFNLRLVPTKNNQSLGIRFAKDYLRVA